MKRILVFVVVIILAVGCSDIDSKREALQTTGNKSTLITDDALEINEEMKPPRTGEPQAPPVSNEVDQNQSKIIKEGAITLEVDSLEITKHIIDSIVKSTNAYLENEVYNGGANQHRYTLKIRIPNSEFETFISLLETGGGKMVNKSINARDVTSEYIDLEIRLKNNQAYLAQYRALLKKAKSIKDVLEIQEKARRIASEIDSQLGRMKYINDQVKYSTITLNIYQKHVYKNTYASPSFGSRVWDSTKFGFSTMQEMILWIIAFWPVMILIVIGYMLRRLYLIRKGENN